MVPRLLDTEQTADRVIMGLTEVDGVVGGDSMDCSGASPYGCHVYKVCHVYQAVVLAIATHRLYNTTSIERLNLTIVITPVPIESTQSSDFNGTPFTLLPPLLVPLLHPSYPHHRLHNQSFHESRSRKAEKFRHCNPACALHHLYRFYLDFFRQFPTP